MRAIRNALLGLAVATTAGALENNSHADGIYNPPLTGNTQHDAWSSSSLTLAANPGFPGFPGTSPWPSSIQSNSGGDAALDKIANGTSGGPYPAGESIYYGGFSGDFNNDGGTLAVSDATPVAGLANVVFQIQIGEAWGYDFFNGILPVLSYNGGAQHLAATYSTLTEQIQTGTVVMPSGEEPIYKNSYLLQWDLTGIADPIQDFSIQFTGVQHAQLYALQLDQSDVYTSLAPQAAVPEPASMSLLFCGVAALIWRTRRSR